MNRYIIDTGPIVALLNRRDRHHAWIRKVLSTVEPPLFTLGAAQVPAVSRAHPHAS